MKVPKKGSKRYREILTDGCGLVYDPWNGDYDCSHGYEWCCEYCPINEELRELDYGYSVGKGEKYIPLSEILELIGE